MASVPNPQFDTDKAAVLSVIKARECREIRYISDRAQSYEDLLALMYEYAKTFDCDPDHLDALLAPIPDNTLLQYGIYRGKVQETVDNPTWLVNCQITTVTISGYGVDTYSRKLEIAKGSKITNLIVRDTTLPSITIAGGSEVDLLDVQPTGRVGSVTLKTCGELTGKLNRMGRDSQLEDLVVGEGSTFGKLVCLDPPAEPPASEPLP